MARVRAQDLVVEFPIYGSGMRSLKKSIVSTATGGRLARDASSRIVVRALDEVTFELNEGDRVGLVGHNGSGKSTLLRVLAGVFEPQQGYLSVEGGVSSMLSITLGMDMEATGRENIFLRGHVMGIPPHRMRELMGDIADFTELGDYLDLPMKTYSTGMMMRLAFAVSTAVDADIVLMDEWISVGDASFANKSQMRMERLIQGAKIVVLATHNLGLVKTVCNRLIRLDHGALVQDADVRT